MLTEENVLEKVKKVGGDSVQTRISKMMRIDWIGQTLASLFWIISVFAYGGPEGLGDWLQLMAASSWLLSNIASILI
ncbi:MAG: hypothetical protein CMA21_01790 [Euryarchaeota archaeon]|nr:hypothetical protein [Euryarchaeota archaeon]|tara:strand:+ start:1672 stop:1902 length:231 start_codon:yes stop_codon:yes gene_type:complete